MGLLEQLHQERKARLERIEQAAFKSTSAGFSPEPLQVNSNTLPFDSFDIILNEICAYYKTRVEDIFSPRRMLDLANKRMVLAYMVYLLTPLSNPQIAAKMKRDPSSIWYAINKMRSNLANYAETIAELEQRIRPLLEERGRRVGKKAR